MKLNYKAMIELLEQDVRWVKKQKRTLERDHVIAILEYLIKEEQDK